MFVIYIITENFNFFLCLLNIIYLIHHVEYMKNWDIFNTMNDTLVEYLIHKIIGMMYKISLLIYGSIPLVGEVFRPHKKLESDIE